MPVYKALIFDLGNVIINVDTNRTFDSWACALGIEPWRVGQSMAFDEEYRQFEKGLVTPAEYEAHTAALLGKSFPPGAFAAGWNAVFDGLVPGIVELLPRLKRTRRLAMLTNTNELHSHVWMEKYKSVLPYFEKIYQSFQLKTRKPEAGAFIAALVGLGVRPEEAVFLDDLEENVRAARALGLTGIVVTSFAQMVADLRAIGIAA
jgi:HAD superfamily hydrolase (TIGR01509 family)